MDRRFRWKWVILAAAVTFAVVGGILVGFRVPFSSDRLRREVIKTLSERLQADVELARLELHPFPRMRAIGEGLVIHHRRRPDVAFLEVQRFTVGAEFLGLLRQHVAHVRLEGLAIRIPPRLEGDEPRADGPAAPPGSGMEDPGARVQAGRSPAEPASPASAARSGEDKAPKSQIVIDHLVADGATLTLLPRDAAKRPKVWQLHELEIREVSLGRPMPFRSVLTNAVPPGDIQTSGSFGPWDADDPGLTPLTGTFVFERADLSVFNGIAGILSSKGRYEGTLGRIESHGETHTPDFSINTSKQPVALDADYHAVIDGTNGDTTLERVVARLLETEIVATGGVYDLPGAERGRRVALDVSIDSGRLEDILRLAMPTPKPTMTGGLRLNTTLVIPPGDVEVVEKLGLKGTFSIDDGRFTNAEVQNRINSLSGRARADETPGTANVTSDFSGAFALNRARLSLSPLRFTIPGALVEVNGSYHLRSEQLAFAGQLLMEAKLSQAVDGWKSWLLKPFDPLFRKDGRTFIPVRISGTRNSPRFGLDAKRVFNKDAPPRTDPAPAKPRKSGTPAKPTKTRELAKKPAA